MAMSSIQNHYVRKFGVPCRTAEYTTSTNSVEVFKWNQSQTDEGVTLYATSGASTYLGDSSKSCEFFIGITPEVDDIAEALADVAIEGSGSKQRPVSGDSITLSYPLWSLTEISSFMFTDGDEIIPPIIIDSRKINFIQLVPLYPSELAFKISHDEESLWKKFQKKNVPYWDSSRKSAW